MSLSDELLSLSSIEMRRRIGTKEVSPVELVEASIARIEALNPSSPRTFTINGRGERVRSRSWPLFAASLATKFLLPF